MTHTYGPHRPEDNPTTVTVPGVGKYAAYVEIPYPEALARQRAQINGLAYAAARRG